jgi:hypothetical protein
MSRQRAWCFTLHDPTELLDPEVLGCTYLVYQEETAPDTGRHHFQGYIEFANGKTLAAVKKLFESDSIHLEKRQGSPEQARAYCMKDESRVGGPYEWGTITNQGKRNDLLEVKQKIDENVSNLDIAESHFATWCRYNKSFEAYRALKAPKRSLAEGELQVIVITGATGLGKSFLVHDAYPDAHWQPSARDRKGVPFYNDYHGQSSIVLDEFYGWLPFDHLLRLCDRYPLTLETKGGHIQCQAKTIIFTSNHDPRRWYPNISTHYEAFERRVTKWIQFTSYKTYQEISLPADDYRTRADRFYEIAYPTALGQSVNFIQ